MKARIALLAAVASPLGILAACSDSENTVDTAPYTRERLLDPLTCKECHPKHYDEWSGSMHAYASTDPVFRAMNARGQKETNNQLGPFCAKCHAPMALAEGATKDGTDLDSVPGSLQGITCYFCHNVTDVNGTHNNPLLLANDVTMRGGIQKPTKYRGHTAEYSPFFDDSTAESAKFCGSCHDIVVPAHFSGASADVALERTFTEWSSSLFADMTAPNHLTCASSCHMGRERDVPVASPPEKPPMLSRVRHLHDFPGIDTALTDFPHMDDQKRSITDTLNISLRLVACVDPISNSGISITLENLSAGHNFPSGASQDRRMWVEVHGYATTKDADGASVETEVFSSGVVPAGVAATEVDGTWLLRDETLKADGTTPAHTFWDAAIIKQNTISVGQPGGIDKANLNQKGMHFPGGKGRAPTHVTVTVWLEPIGLDVLDDMIDSGFLDKGVRDKMPRFTIIPPAPGNTEPSTVTMDWTLAKARGPKGYPSGLELCLETTQTPSAVTLPPASP